MDRKIKVNGNYIENNYGNVSSFKEKENPLKEGFIFYKQWWFISLIIGFITSIFTYISFMNFWVSFIAFVASSLTLLFFNPQKKFFRMAVVCIGLLGINSFGFEYLYTSDYLFINIDDKTIPWMSIIYGVLAVALFILDYYHNKSLNKL